jgi:hypothetical protein
LVLLSAEEYRRLQELEERAFHISDLTAVELSSLSEVVIPAEAKLYNEEMK